MRHQRTAGGRTNSHDRRSSSISDSEKPASRGSCEAYFGDRSPACLKWSGTSIRTDHLRSCRAVCPRKVVTHPAVDLLAVAHQVRGTLPIDACLGTVFTESHPSTRGLPSTIGRTEP